MRFRKLVSGSRYFKEVDSILGQMIYLNKRMTLDSCVSRDMNCEETIVTKYTIQAVRDQSKRLTCCLYYLDYCDDTARYHSWSLVNSLWNNMIIT